MISELLKIPRVLFSLRKRRQDGKENKAGCQRPGSSGASARGRGLHHPRCVAAAGGRECGARGPLRRTWPARAQSPRAPGGLGAPGGPRLPSHGGSNDGTAALRPPARSQPNALKGPRAGAPSAPNHGGSGPGGRPEPLKAQPALLSRDVGEEEGWSGDGSTANERAGRM